MNDGTDLEEITIRQHLLRASKDIRLLRDMTTYALKGHRTSNQKALLFTFKNMDRVMVSDL